MSADLRTQFLQFCRSKPADEGYNPWANCGCALFQFLSAAGYPVAVAGFYSWDDVNGNEHIVLPRDSASRLILAEPRTFGALAQRLESAS